MFIKSAMYKHNTVTYFQIPNNLFLVLNKKIIFFL
jgi:hypothetical protein